MSDLESSIKQLRDQGLTYRQIQLELNCSLSTISYYLGENQPKKTEDRRKALEKEIRTMLREYKESNPCTDCGRKFNYFVMQFDHLPGSNKSFNISQFKRHTKDINIIIAEIAKCELVCANCHATREFFRREAVKEGIDVTEIYIDELD